jgi:hypothetical protein
MRKNVFSVSILHTSTLHELPMTYQNGETLVTLLRKYGRNGLIFFAFSFLSTFCLKNRMMRSTVNKITQKIAFTIF